VRQRWVLLFWGPFGGSKKKERVTQRRPFGIRRSRENGETPGLKIRGGAYYRPEIVEWWETMSLNALEIALVSRILHRDLSGAVVQEILSPANGSGVVICLRSPGRNHHLQLGLEAGMTRIGRISARPGSAPTPHPFVMLLRKRLGGARLKEVSELEGDRVVTLDFSRRDRGVRLVCELTSRHANLFLINEEGLISGSFFPNRSHLRKLVPGEPYQPPFPHPVDGETQNRFEAAPDLEEAIEAHYQRRLEKAKSDAATREVRRLITAARRHLTRLEGNLPGRGGQGARGPRPRAQGQPPRGEKG
jgi:hypothetical protein